jgi:hypothetical protein
MKISEIIESIDESLWVGDEHKKPSGKKKRDKKKKKSSRPVIKKGKIGNIAKSSSPTPAKTKSLSPKTGPTAKVSLAGGGLSP